MSPRFGSFFAMRRSSATPNSTARRRLRRMRIACILCLAARDTPPATFLLNGEFYPCVQFPLSCGSSASSTSGETPNQLKEVRSIRRRDLSSCSQCAHGASCTRCPGLAFLEGNMRGPSTADCEKSFARTGIPSASLLAKKGSGSAPRLAQIQLVPAITGNRLSGMGARQAL